VVARKLNSEQTLTITLPLSLPELKHDTKKTARIITLDASGGVFIEDQSFGYLHFE
jgi:hypothetical protein